VRRAGVACCIAAARILEGQRRGEPGEENQLAFETFPQVALVKTYNTNQQVPDSAGTMTAIMTGTKTRAGVIGVDPTVPRGDAAAVAGHELRTLFEEAEDRGLATGVVTTTPVTHATPAACYAHGADRRWEDDSELTDQARDMGFPDFARQLVEFPHGDGIDVALGGGRTHFQPRGVADVERPQVSGSRLDGRDLIAEWQARHPRGRYVWNREQFQSVDPARTPQLLGLFEPLDMNFEVDREKDVAGEPSLAEMTATAIEILSRDPDGFVLMVEGGRIDHGHHLGNAYLALTETIAMSDAVRAALAHVDLGQTLVLVTADHGHTLTIGGYPTRGNPILGKVVENDERGEPMDRYARDAAGLPYTTLGYRNGPGYRSAPVDLSDVDTTAPDFRQEAAIPLQAETHSGEDVPVYATGAGAALFHGVREQSWIHDAISEALGWKPHD
jgi:alkaline phosphatase